MFRLKRVLLMRILKSSVKGTLGYFFCNICRTQENDQLLLSAWLSCNKNILTKISKQNAFLAFAAMMMVSKLWRRVLVLRLKRVLLIRMLKSSIKGTLGFLCNTCKTQENINLSCQL